MPYSSVSYLGYLYGVTPGTVTASKAVIVDANKDISSFRYLTSQLLTATSQIKLTNTSTTIFDELAAASLSGVCLADLSGTTGELNTNAISFFNSTSSISSTPPNASITMIKTPLGDSTGHLVFHTKSGLLNTSRCSERMRIQADGFIGVNTFLANKQLSINHSTGACLRLIRNNTAGSETLYSDLSIDASGNLVLTSSGGYIDLQALKLNGSIVTATATELNYNDITTIGTAQASKSLVVDSNIDISSIRRLHCANISIGTSDFSLTSRLLVMVDSTLTAGGARYLTLGKSHSTYNNAEWGYYHVGDGNSLNRCEFGFYGANGIFAVVANRRVGINTTTPTVELDVSGAIAVSGLLTSSNTTNATNYTTGSVQLAGGMSITKSLYVNSNIQTSSFLAIAGSLTGVTFIDASGYIATTLTTDSTSTSTGALIIDGGAGIKKNLYIGGKLYCVDTNVSTTSTSNSVQFSGGLYMAKAILNNSYYNCNTINSSATSQATSIQAICLNDHAIYFRSQNSGDTNHGLMYSKNASWNSGNGFASANVDGPVLYGYGGVLIANLNSSGTQTECARFVGNKCTIKETLQIGSSSSAQLFIGTTGMVNPQGPVNINGTGGHVKMSYNNATGTETVYTSVGCGSTGFQTLACVNGAQSWSYYFDSLGKFSTGNSLPRFDVDFGNVANDFKVCLYNLNNLSPTYGFGANDSALMYHSAGSNGHRWYINTTGGVAAPNTVGTKYMELTSAGLNIPAGAITSTINTYSTKHFSGSGVELNSIVNGNTDGGYGTYSNHPFNIRTNNTNRIQISATGNVGIGLSATYLLDVSHTSQNLTGGYAYYTSSDTSGTGSSTGNQNFSARFSGRIAVAGEVDVYSDKRIKTNITDLDEEYVDKFMSLKAKNYVKKTTNRKELGFIAQDVVKLGLDELYMLHNTEIDEDIEDDGFINPKDRIFTLNYIEMIPILFKKIQMMDKKIKDLEKNI